MSQFFKIIAALIGGLIVLAAVVFANLRVYPSCQSKDAEEVTYIFSSCSSS